MAFVHLAPPALCIVCCVVSTSPVGLPLVLSPGGPSLPPWCPSCICLSLTHLVYHTNTTRTILHKLVPFCYPTCKCPKAHKKGFYFFSFFESFYFFKYNSCLISIFDKERAFNSNLIPMKYFARPQCCNTEIFPLMCLLQFS